MCIRVKERYKHYKFEVDSDDIKTCLIVIFMDLLIFERIFRNKFYVVFKMLINIISINLIKFICEFNSNPVLELRYYDRLYSTRSLNVYWIIEFEFKIELLLSTNI